MHDLSGLVIVPPAEAEGSRKPCGASTKAAASHPGHTCDSRPAFSSIQGGLSLSAVRRLKRNVVCLQLVLQNQENPPLMKAVSWTRAAPYKEERHHRSPSESIANNFTPSASNLKLRHLHRRTRSHCILQFYFLRTIAIGNLCQPELTLILLQLPHDICLPCPLQPCLLATTRHWGWQALPRDLSLLSSSSRGLRSTRL